MEGKRGYWAFGMEEENIVYIESDCTKGSGEDVGDTSEDMQH